jgi:hypothetical protein
MYSDDKKAVEAGLMEGGIDVKMAERLLTAGRDFRIVFKAREDKTAMQVLQKVRPLIYNWLRLLGIKQNYKVLTRDGEIILRSKMPLKCIDLGILIEEL